MTTPIESLRKQYVEGGWTFVSQLQSRKQTEGLHIDFKQKKDSATGEIHSKDIQQLAEALSGFANADGGVLVWGVNAEKDADGIDQVVDILPIKQLARFRSELEGVTPAAVSPPVEGVEHIAIPISPNLDEGVVLSVIPKSEATPHMARGKDQHRYYQRTNSSFLRMEHHQVADLFGRRPQPVMSVRPFWELQPIGGGVGQFRFMVQFMVQNNGRGLGRYSSLTIGNTSPDWPINSATDASNVGGPFRKVHAPYGWMLRYRGAADDVLHPGDRFTVAYIASPLSIQDSRTDFRVRYEVIAEGCPLVSGFLEVPFIKLITAMKLGRGLKPADHPDNDKPPSP